MKVSARRVPEMEHSASATDSHWNSHSTSPSISQQDLLGPSPFHSCSMTKPDNNSSAASTHNIDLACQASSVITRCGCCAWSSKAAEQDPSCPLDFVDGSDGSDAVQLIPWREGDSSSSQGGYRSISQNSAQARHNDYWSSFQSHLHLADRSPGHHSGGIASSFSGSEEWKMLLSSAEAESSASQSHSDENFNPIRAVQDDSPCYLKLCSTTEMLVAGEHRLLSLGDSEGLSDSAFTSGTPRRFRETSLYPASSDTTIDRSEAYQFILGRPSATSISVPDFSHLEGYNRGEDADIMDSAYTTCVPMGDEDSSCILHEPNTSCYVVRDKADVGLQSSGASQHSRQRK